MSLTANETVEEVVLAFRALTAIDDFQVLKIAKSGFFYSLNASMSGVEGTIASAPTAG